MSGGDASLVLRGCYAIPSNAVVRIRGGLFLSSSVNRFAIKKIFSFGPHPKGHMQWMD